MIYQYLPKITNTCQELPRGLRVTKSYQGLPRLTISYQEKVNKSYKELPKFEKMNQDLPRITTSYQDLPSKNY